MFKRKYLPFLVSFLLFVTVSIISFKIPEETVKNFVAGSGIFGPIILLVLIWLTNFFAPLAAGPFLFAGFYLYGNKVVLISFIAACMAFITNFWVARLFGRTLVKKLAGDEIFTKIDELSGKYGYKTLIFVRLLLSQQHDVISYAAGLTNFTFFKYLSISFFCSIPGTLLTYFLSARLNNPYMFYILLIVLGYAALLTYYLINKLWKKLYNRR